MRLCFRAFEAVKLMTSGASPIAQNVRSRVEGPSYIAAKNIHVGGDGRGIIMAWLLMPLARGTIRCPKSVLAR
jgi:hypothetical protein